MNRTKLYVSAALFLFITVFKLTAPTAASDLREEILPIISQSTDYTQAIQVIGEKLTADAAETPGEIAAEEISLPSFPEIETLEKHIKTNYQIVYDRMTSPENSEAEKAPSEEIFSEEPELPEAVAAFFAAQQPYSGYGVPETVSYELLELPFAYTSPVSGMASSGFGYRLHPIFNEVKFHYGTDFSAWTGTPIQAFADGFVQAAGNSDSYGLYLIISHGNGWRTLYAHCSQLNVTEGAAVTMGQEIALAGDTGQTTGPHLHFELMCGDIYHNPEFYINC